MINIQLPRVTIKLIVVKVHHVVQRKNQNRKKFTSADYHQMLTKNIWLKSLERSVKLKKLIYHHIVFIPIFIEVLPILNTRHQQVLNRHVNTWIMVKSTDKK